MSAYSEVFQRECQELAFEMQLDLNESIMGSAYGPWECASIQMMHAHLEETAERMGF